MIRGLASALLGLVAVAAGATAPLERWQTPNGVPVWFVAARELPMADVRVVFDAGSARDGEHSGIARLTASMLVEGTTTRSGQALSERLADLGAVLSTAVDRDSARASLRSLSDPGRLDPAVDLLAGILSQPAFDVAVLARERDRQRVRLSDREQSPGDRLADASYAALYAGHPYATPVDGTPATLATIDTAAVRAFHARHYVAAAAFIVIVGDLDRAGAQALAARIGAALPAGTALPPLPPAPAATPTTVRVPAESTQTHVALAHPGVRPGDPDDFALLVGNHVLGGGGLTGRLFRELREKRGLSYGAYSEFRPLRAGGPWIASVATRNDQAGEALAALRAEVAGYLATGPDDAEIEAARANLVGGFPLRIASNAKLLDYVAFIALHGLPADYLDRYAERVAAVTRPVVRDALARRLVPGLMTTVVVGGAAGP